MDIAFEFPAAGWPRLGYPEIFAAMAAARADRHDAICTAIRVGAR